MSGFVVFGGSRRLPVAGSQLVAVVARAVLANGQSIAVGCAVGADEAVLCAVPFADRARVHVFAVHGVPVLAQGADLRGWQAPGSWRGSAVRSVAAHAAKGGPVSWWAGGAGHVPLVARLSGRTRACVRAATAGAVLFFGSPSSVGTALCGRLAAARGLPVRAFPLGFDGSALPSLGAGAWEPVNGPGVWAGAWAWVPSSAGFF